MCIHFPTFPAGVQVATPVLRQLALALVEASAYLLRPLRGGLEMALRALVVAWPGVARGRGPRTILAMSSLGS